MAENETHNLLLPGLFQKVRKSKLVQDAAALLVLNVTSRGFAFFGTAYAARCLGPTYLGTSALIQATVQQVALVYNGGFDTIAVRRIAADQTRSNSLASSITYVRLTAAFMLLIAWISAILLFVPTSQRFAWLVSAPLIVTSAMAIAFVFQGLERLPIQNAIVTGGAILTAAFYFLFFHRGMFLGADLLVISGVGVITAVGSWTVYRKLYGSWPIGKPSRDQILGILRESWRYWALAIIVFFYSTFQIPLVAGLLGARQAGIFRSAFLMAAGVELLFNSINSLLLARLVIWKERGLHIMWSQQARLMVVFLAIGIPLTALLFLSAPFVYRVLLGSAFAEGVTIFQILVIGRLVVFVGQIYAWGLAAVGLDTQFVVASLLGAVTSVALNILLIPKYGLVAAACIAVFVEILIHGYSFGVLRIHVTREVDTLV